MSANHVEFESKGLHNRAWDDDFLGFVVSPLLAVRQSGHSDFVNDQITSAETTLKKTQDIEDHVRCPTLSADRIHLPHLIQGTFAKLT